MEKFTLPYTLCCENPGKCEKFLVLECSIITIVPDLTIEDDNINSGTSSNLGWS